MGKVKPALYITAVTLTLIGVPFKFQITNIKNRGQTTFFLSQIASLKYFRDIPSAVENAMDKNI